MYWGLRRYMYVWMGESNSKISAMEKKTDTPKGTVKGTEIATVIRWFYDIKSTTKKFPINGKEYTKNDDLNKAAKTLDLVEVLDHAPNAKWSDLVSVIHAKGGEDEDNKKQIQAMKWLYAEREGETHDPARTVARIYSASSCVTSAKTLGERLRYLYAERSDAEVNIGGPLLKGGDGRDLGAYVIDRGVLFYWLREEGTNIDDVYLYFGPETPGSRVEIIGDGAYSMLMGLMKKKRKGVEIPSLGDVAWSEYAGTDAAKLEKREGVAYYTGLEFDEFVVTQGKTELLNIDAAGTMSSNFSTSYTRSGVTGMGEISSKTHYMGKLSTISNSSKRYINVLPCGLINNNNAKSPKTIYGGGLFYVPDAFDRIIQDSTNEESVVLYGNMVVGKDSDMAVMYAHAGHVMGKFDDKTFKDALALLNLNTKSTYVREMLKGYGINLK